MKNTKNNESNCYTIVSLLNKNNKHNRSTLIPIFLIMSNRKDQLKGGINAMFGETQTPAPAPREITEEQYTQMERKQSERRFFMTGRKVQDNPSLKITQNDVRTSMILDKDQYNIIKEIALRETMTIKDLMFAMFQLAIDRYEQKNGKVIIRSEQKTAKDLF